jgi:hypothetical protein
MNGRGGRRYAPYVFTEQGVAMLSSVLRSSRAVKVNVAIMRTFVRLREMLATHEDLRRNIDAIREALRREISGVFEAIRQMLETPIPKKKAIGFTPNQHPRQSRLDRPALAVSNRKHTFYMSERLLPGLENTPRFGYTYPVVDSQKIPTNRHVHQGIQALQ